MEKEQNLFPLKTLVLSLGALLIGGTVVLVAGLYGKGQGGCASGTVDLRGRGALNGINTQGERVYVSIPKEPGRLDIVTIDPCTGKEQATLTLMADPQKAASSAVIGQ